MPHAGEGGPRVSSSTPEALIRSGPPPRPDLQFFSSGLCRHELRLARVHDDGQAPVGRARGNCCGAPTTPRRSAPGGSGGRRPNARGARREAGAVEPGADQGVGARIRASPASSGAATGGCARRRAVVSARRRSPRSASRGSPRSGRTCYQRDGRPRYVGDDVRTSGGRSPGCRSGSQRRPGRCGRTGCGPSPREGCDRPLAPRPRALGAVQRLNWRSTGERGLP